MATVFRDTLLTRGGVSGAVAKKPPCPPAGGISSACSLPLRNPIVSPISSEKYDFCKQPFWLWRIPLGFPVPTKTYDRAAKGVGQETREIFE